MKVLILGASGIIGQHLRLCVPPGIEPIWVRHQADGLHEGLDCADWDAVKAFLGERQPEVIVNLAGESNTDVVERDPKRYHVLNSRFPAVLARWCDGNKAHLIHVSTQAVFDGENPPYSPDSRTNPVNAYGRQKLEAEMRVRDFRNWTIVRPTFVLGVRPLKHVGRANPLESMLAAMHQKQVDDRWFSIAVANHVAGYLWELVQARPRAVFHVGTHRVSRWEIARLVAPDGAAVERVSHDSFPGIAPRPKDTAYDTYQTRPLGRAEWLEHFTTLMTDTIESRAREIALFFGITEAAALERVNRGFGPLHNDVAADWNAANPKADDQILDWYRKTESYIWELTAYHLHPGFNYSGMCDGIAEHLKSAGLKRVLCLGDGIGDLTLALSKAGMEAFYHDLSGSRTAQFAAFRFWNQTGNSMSRVLSNGWAPEIGKAEWDAIVSLDFLEHVTDVPAWTRAIRDGLKPGGLFFAQNAFDCGSGPDGSIPMHLAINDRYAKDWDPELSELGFVQLSNNWYRAPAKAMDAQLRPAA